MLSKDKLHFAAKSRGSTFGTVVSSSASECDLFARAGAVDQQGRLNQVDAHVVRKLRFAIEKHDPCVFWLVPIGRENNEA